MAPWILLKTQQRLRADSRQDLAIVGIYHSHPGGSPIPSSHDLQLAWPQYSYWIIALDGTMEPAKVKSWHLVQDHGFEEEPLTFR
ncbi:MAG: hypothetical protein HC796_04775 [Synechococcaceae cyanobacterium RL_1_2]|nr:hypothetical protein [Synechococcaceae cyanobacterium RL_1_2]